MLETRRVLETIAIKNAFTHTDYHTPHAIVQNKMKFTEHKKANDLEMISHHDPIKCNCNCGLPRGCYFLIEI